MGAGTWREDVWVSLCVLRPNEGPWLDSAVGSDWERPGVAMLCCSSVGANAVTNALAVVDGGGNSEYCNLSVGS